MASKCGHRVEIMGPTQAWDPLHQLPNSDTEALSWKVEKGCMLPRGSPAFSHNVPTTPPRANFTCTKCMQGSKIVHFLCLGPTLFVIPCKNFFGHYRFTMLQLPTLTTWILSSTTILSYKIVRMLNIRNSVSIIGMNYMLCATITN